MNSTVMGGNLKFSAREAAIPDLGRLLAAVDSHGTVVVYDFHKEAAVTTFASNHALGGKRLALSPIADACLVGSYDEACDSERGADCGVTCYSARDGKRRWSRSDLKRTQSLRCLTDFLIFARFEDGVACTLNAATGESVDSLIGVKEMWGNPDHGTVWEADGKLKFVTSHGRTKDVDLESFAVLDAKIFEDRVLVSEAAGPVRCFTLNGIELWRYDPPAGTHVLYFGTGNRQAPLGVEWEYEAGGDYTIFRFSGLVPEKLGTFRKSCLGFLPGSNQLIRWDLTKQDFG